VWHWNPEYFSALQFLTIMVVPLLVIDLMLERTQDEYVLQSHGWNYRVAAGVAWFAAITLFSANDASAFIYFQF
jgi:hypothetical protein